MRVLNLLSTKLFSDPYFQCYFQEARYSNTSYTVMRRPRMQGLPPRFSGSIEIRFFQSIWCAA
jgi:hypothetical protein